MMSWTDSDDQLVISDVIEWTETVWPPRKPRRRQRPKPLGRQKVTGQITALEEEFVTLIVLKSEIIENPHRADIRPHQVGKAITKKRQTILKGEPHRLHWSEEDVRAVLLAESVISD